jgi:hypothetical protein
MKATKTSTPLSLFDMLMLLVTGLIPATGDGGSNSTNGGVAG